MGILSERAKRRAEDAERRARQVAPLMADAERYRPSDGVGVKAADPEPPKFVKVTLIVETDKETRTLIVEQALVSTELVPDPADVERQRRERARDALYGEFRVHQPPRPGLFKVEIRPHPDVTEGTWGRVEVRQKPLAEKETNQ